MNTPVVTTKATCLSTSPAARPFASAAASGIYAVWSAGTAGVAKHSLKQRSAMDRNTDGRPLGPQNGTSG